MNITTLLTALFGSQHQVQRHGDFLAGDATLDGHTLRAIGTTEHPTNRHSDNIHKRVYLRALNTRVFERCEVIKETNSHDVLLKYEHEK